MSDLNKRLEELEKIIKTNVKSPVWIDGKNNVIRVDVNHRRGKEVTFPTVYDAGVWIEKQIDAHAGGIIGYWVDNICDLCEDAQALRSVIKDILPGKIIVQRSSGQVIGGQIQPLVLSADDLPGCLAISRFEPGMKADLRLWCLAGLITQYFDRCEFIERWKSQQMTDDDNTMLLALLVIFGWRRPGTQGEILMGFYRFFHQVVDLPGNFVHQSEPN